MLLSTCCCSAQCLEYLGTRFRVLLGSPRSHHPLRVAYELLRDHVFIHIDADRPADKLALLLHMLNKLYALVSAWWGGARLLLEARRACVGGLAQATLPIA
jgi:hypothetical protein